MHITPLEILNKNLKNTKKAFDFDFLSLNFLRSHTFFHRFLLVVRSYISNALEVMNDPKEEKKKKEE